MTEAYFSISDGRTCNLVFTYLAQDTAEYSNNLESFVNHPDFKKRLEILIYSQSDCCIVRKNISEAWDDSIKGIVDVYR